MEHNNQNKKAISLFSGAGGDTIGLEKAKYNVVAFSEYIKPFIKTHLKAFPESKLIEYLGESNIRNIPDELFTFYRGQIDLIFAGFPCQGFSHAGKKNESDPRNELVYEFVRAVNCIRPEWIIGENVSGLLSRKSTDPKTGEKTHVINIINSIFNEIGYSLTWSVVTATDFNVPQKRKRVIIIGHDNSKAHLNKSYPHFNFDCLVSQQNPPPTIRHILEDTLDGAIEFPKENIPQNINTNIWIRTHLVETTTSVHPNLLRLVKGIRNKSSKELNGETENKSIIVPGGLISFGKRISGYHGEVVDPDQPSKTIICTYGTCPRLFVGLYNQSTDKYWIRPFTLNELTQIQSFPKDYQFSGNNKEIITQIGNAVPPNIVQYITEHLSTIVFKSYQQRTDTSSNSISDDDD